MRVVLAGGGTAGHIEPALALADALRRGDPNTQITCLGTERGLETRLVPQRGYELALIPAVPLPRTLTPQLLAVPGRLRGAINSAASVLDRTQADVLVGFGGYVATPGYLAARKRKVPIVVHEANPRPGLANRLGSRFTQHVAVSNPDNPLPHAKFVGVPLRREIATLDRLAMGDKARSYFGLLPDLPTLLIFGGSQGARSLNRAAVASAGWFRQAGVQVLHIVGPKNTVDVTPGVVPYVVVPYVDEMQYAYAAADFVVCRSGAMTCAELGAVGLPAVYVPLPLRGGEQRLNAESVAAAGGAVIVENEKFDPAWVEANLLPILTDPGRVAAMAAAAAQAGARDADVVMARYVLDLVAAGRGGTEGTP
jgi:UDP-N-acetylglucosamine--N-acetylmuramyl-(pentapeptide) pyrophosphoryl-undecaprenol N-acetylglucosamine transferase